VNEGEPVSEGQTLDMRVGAVDYQAQAVGQIANLLACAQVLTIASPEDEKRAANDLIIMGTIKKRLEALRVEKVKPLNDEVDSINASFKTIMAPLKEADNLTNKELLRYRQAEKAKRDEALAIEAERRSLEQRAAKLNDGIAVSFTPVTKPDEPPRHIQLDAGSVSVRQLPQWELEDITRVPAEFLILDKVAVGKQVRAGRRNIPGIRIWMEDSLAVREKK